MITEKILKLSSIFHELAIYSLFCLSRFVEQLNQKKYDPLFPTDIYFFGFMFYICFKEQHWVMSTFAVVIGLGTQALIAVMRHYEVQGMPKNDLNAHDITCFVSIIVLMVLLLVVSNINDGMLKRLKTMIIERLKNWKVGLDVFGAYCVF